VGDLGLLFLALGNDPYTMIFPLLIWALDNEVKLVTAIEELS
jgi:hypothetical protein